MKKIIFLLLMLPVIMFGQDKKYNPDKYYFRYDWYVAPPLEPGKDCPVCEGEGFIARQEKPGGKVWRCVQVENKFRPATKKTGDSIKIKVAKLEKSDINQNSRLDNHESRISKLETNSIEKPETVTAFKGPEKLEKRVEKLEEKTVPPSPPAPKKEDPDPGPAREAPTETVAVPPSFFVEPELGVFWKNNNSPEFISKSLWLASVGLRLRYQPQNWQGVFIFAKPSWVNIFGKSYLPETTPSPYPTQAVSLNGFLAEAGLGYKIWDYTEISAGYAYAISKSMEHESGVFAHLEFGLENFPVKAQLGLRYKHDLSFFGGVVARFPLEPKN